MKKKLVAVICASMVVFAGCSSSSSNEEVVDNNDVAVETTDESVETESEEVSTTLATENLDEVVMVIDGVEISKALYMLYDYTTTQNFYAMTMSMPWDSSVEGMTEEEFIQNRIIETLQSIVVAIKYADENGIAIAETDQMEIDMATEEFMANLPADVIAKIGFTVESLNPYMAESYIHSRVYDEISLSYTIEDNAYNEYYALHGEAIAMDYTLLDLNSILVEDPTIAEEVGERARAGEDFNSLFYEYDISTEDPSSEETGALTISQGQFLNTFVLEEEIELNQIIGPIEMNGSYFVFLVEGIDRPAGEDLDGLVNDIFLSNAEIEYADTIISDLIDELDTVINYDALDNTEKFYQ